MTNEMDWNLFANGKFYALFSRNGVEKVYLLTGCEVYPKLGVPRWRLWLDDNHLVWADQCTLIARKIEDMSDEVIAERMNTPPPLDYGFGDHIRSTLIGSANSANLTFLAATHLLQNGIYTGPQSHFKEGRVIHSKTIMENEYE